MEYTPRESNLEAMTAPAEKPDIIPGTDIILTGGEYGEDANTKEIVLIPQPSSSLDDPLNWSKAWKATVVFNLFIFVFVSVMTPMAISPMALIFEAEFHKTLPEVNMLFGAAAITLGYANFLIVPAANMWGRRPVILVCSLICIAANTWQALVTSYPSFLGARVISGIGVAATQSIMPMVVADVMFQHRRGSSMALYFWAQSLGSLIGPVISGAIASHISWRWFFWVCTILQGASFLFLLFAYPETKYDRPPPSTSTTNNTTLMDNRLATPTTNKLESDIVSSSSSQLHMTQTTTPTTPAILTTAHRLPSGRPSKAQFSLFPMRNRRDFLNQAEPEHDDHHRQSNFTTVLARDVLSPVKILLAYPIVLWASFTMGFSGNMVAALNLTCTQVFGAPPYLFTPAQIGFLNFALIVGAVVSLVTAGPLSDWIAVRRARQNGGVLEAEMRLPALIPYVCVCVVGTVVVAVGDQRAWSWEVIVVLGYTLIGLQMVGVPTIVIAYAVDSYKSLPGEVMIAATVVRDTFGFGMILFFNDWVAQSGYIKPLLMMMGITVGFCIIGLCLFIPYGKTFRRWTKDSKLHSL
ncbi:hypothetical protein M426DRAFT_123597 [Hypoxylon sp. CI-4A]|nr:hypothetical protein M426DRAFT_123597 [Hypoxylon sp. CI-4A]